MGIISIKQYKGVASRTFSPKITLKGNAAEDWPLFIEYVEFVTGERWSVSEIAKRCIEEQLKNDKNFRKFRNEKVGAKGIDEINRILLLEESARNPSLLGQAQSALADQ